MCSIKMRKSCLVLLLAAVLLARDGQAARVRRRVKKDAASVPVVADPVAVNVPPPASPFDTPDKICPTGNVAYEVDGFPGTPFQLNVFKDIFRNPPIVAGQNKACRDDGHCISTYEIEVLETELTPWTSLIPSCAATPTRFLSYAGTIPGPTIVAPAGHETIVRYKNKISGVLNGTVHPCDAPGRSGRPFSVHLHGSASLAPFDGWAEDETCFGEVKEYLYPNNRPVTGWYHDHALHITAANAYYGLAGLYLVSAKAKDGACGEPWNMEDIEELHMILQDKALDSSCQLALDADGPHRDNFYGDINLVSGIPFPKMMLQPKYYRMRVLNAAVSRPYLLKIKNAALNDIGPQVCLVIASDGGFRKEPVAFPASGLLLGVAERYEVVCNLEKYAGQTLYIWNDHNDKVMKDVPYFCYSHLISKIEVAASGSGAVFNAADTTIKPDQPMHRVMSDLDMAQAVAMAQAGQQHRIMKFGKTGGQWAINGETWGSFKIAAADVGQNTWEVWRFETGGGWHPVHIHLVDLYVVRRDSSSRSVETFELNSPKDVFFLGPSEKIWIVARFGAHRGDYMFHCHNLRHEDSDMMRAFTITNGPSKVQPTEPFLTLNNIVYSNWAYANPMLGDTAARKSGGYKKLSPGYSQNMLAKNLYRIFYPNASDVEFLTGPTNPWKAKWEDHCTL